MDAIVATRTATHLSHARHASLNFPAAKSATPTPWRASPFNTAAAASCSGCWAGSAAAGCVPPDSSSATAAVRAPEASIPWVPPSPSPFPGASAVAAAAAAAIEDDGSQVVNSPPSRRVVGAARGGRLPLLFPPQGARVWAATGAGVHEEALKEGEGGGGGTASDARYSPSAASCLPSSRAWSART